MREIKEWLIEKGLLGLFKSRLLEFHHEHQILDGCRNPKFQIESKNENSLLLECRECGRRFELQICYVLKHPVFIIFELE